MSIYRDKCDEIQRMVREITSECAFGTRFGIVVSVTDNCVPEHWNMVQYVEDKFFEDIFIIAQKLRELLDEEEAKNAHINHQDGYSIKGVRDEALLKLYKRYNNLVGLDEITYGVEEATRILIEDIEKLEHARHMEASDEIAKLSIEKLEKLASPMPEIRMSGIPREFRDDLRNFVKKEGSKNDD